MSDGFERQRDRQRTQQKLVQAAIDIVRERGFTGLGINAIAERAGVSKVLLYRYFGDLSGLYRAVAEEVDPLQSQAAHRLLSELDPSLPPDEVIRRVVVELHRAIKHDELTKNLLIWELSNQNTITEAFSAARERTGVELSERFRDRLVGTETAENVDVNALLAIVTAGVFYLTLRSDSVDVYNGIDISSEEGWERIASALAELLTRR